MVTQGQIEPTIVGFSESVDTSVFAAEWWESAEGRLLPGEVTAFTVFAVEFWDGCRYFGVTDMTILDAVDDLMASPNLDRRSRFVSEHCNHMGYVVRCVGSNLTQELAEQLRSDLVVRFAGDVDSNEAGVAVGDACIFSAVPKEPVRMSFGDWVKTREQSVTGGNPK